MAEKDAQEQVQQYRQVVMAYEALQAQIADLLRDKKGTGDLSLQEMEKYRLLARERDALQSEMRYFEQQFSDDEGAS